MLNRVIIEKPEVDLTEVDLQEIYSDETAKTTTATSSSPSSPATVEPGKEEKYDDFNDTDPEKNASTRPLIMYAYSETENARENLRFFLAQGLHGAADFVFILNGETDVGEALIPQKTNIAVVKRPNTCYDLGAHGEVLRNGDLWKRYGRFVLLNASVRGPFVPYWSRACWSDAYLGRVTDEVKVRKSLILHSLSFFLSFFTSPSLPKAYSLHAVTYAYGIGMFTCISITNPRKLPITSL